MPSNHLILCHPLLLLPSIFPSIRVFSKESVLYIRSPNYWSLSFSISLASEYSVLISFRMDWFNLLAVQAFCIKNHKGFLWWLSGKESDCQCRRLEFSRSLDLEDPTCPRVTKAMHYNYWSCVLESQRLKTQVPCPRAQAAVIGDLHATTRAAPTRCN